MAIIAILIFVIFSKLNWINAASTSTSKNTELDKKVDNKLTGLQVSLGEILTEISSATREQKESISKVASIVAAAPAHAHAHAPAPAHVELSAAITTSISTKQSTLGSELFDRSEDTSISKSEFLELDLDPDLVDNPNKVPDALDSELQNMSEVFPASTYMHPDIPASTKSLDSNLHHDSISPANSHHYRHPQSHNHLYGRQRYGEALFESNRETENAGDIIHSFKEVDNNNKGETLTENQDFNKREDSDSEKPSLSTEKNSNPELDKIDKEILDALQRLGGIDNSEDKDNKNDTRSYAKEKIE